MKDSDYPHYIICDIKISDSSPNKLMKSLSYPFVIPAEAGIQSIVKYFFYSSRFPLPQE